MIPVTTVGRIGDEAAPPAPVRTRMDWALEAVALLALIAVFGFALVYWDQLPGGPPRRFRLATPPSAWSAFWSYMWTVKGGLATLMVLNSLTYLTLTWGTGTQRLIVIPSELDRMAPHVRPMMFSLLIVLKAVLMLFALYLAFGLVNVAEGRGALFNGWWLTAFVLAVPLPLVLYTMRLRR